VASLYPTNLDAFRSYVSSFDEMVASDLVDLMDAIVAVQTELGVNPAGDGGTIYGRLFSTGNVSEQTAGWRRLKWGRSGANGFDFDRSRLEGYKVSWSPAPFAGRDTVFGEDVPAPFGALQAPLTTSGPTNRKQVPWRTALNVTRAGEAAWYGQDGDGTQTTFAVRNPELNSGNSVACTWGYIVWTLST